MAKRVKNQLSKPSGYANAGDGADGEGPADDLMPTGDELEELIVKSRGFDTKLATLRGEKGALAKNAEQDLGLDRWSFRIILALDKMDQETRDAHLRHLDSYRLQRGYARQADLFNDPAATPAEDATFAGRGTN